MRAHEFIANRIFPKLEKADSGRKSAKGVKRVRVFSLPLCG